MKSTLKSMRPLSLFFLLAFIVGCNSENNKKDEIRPAAEQVLGRFINERASEIVFKIISDDPGNPGNMVYEVEAKNGKVTVSGNSVVAQCRGAYTYLKEACNSLVTWGGQQIDIPEHWPDYTKKRVVCPYKYTLQDNVCVFGYTNSYNNWEDWDRYLDVMVLHGYNMMFAPVGSEAIWQKVWLDMGFNEEELSELFTGPTFFPWHRMGNLYKHSGPVPKSFFPKSIALQKKIINKMRQLGINPIAPAFAGFVPRGFTEKFTDAEVRQSHWLDFEGEHAAEILHPLSPYFQTIGKSFITEWEKEFGNADFFLADAFNEMKPNLNGNEQEKQKELSHYGKSIYTSITAAKPEATWVMQGWLFLMKDFWTKERAKALLNDVPGNKMLVLDLNAERIPQWEFLDGFFNKQWMYSIIPNWGGLSQIGGELPKYGEEIPEIIKRKDVGNLVAFGMSSEGTENNEVVYELVSDAMWSESKMNLNDWLANYCSNRYGNKNAEIFEAWKLLLGSVYSRPVKHLNRFQARPDGTGYAQYYGNPVKNDSVSMAMELFTENLKANQSNPLYVNDYIELNIYHKGAIADSVLNEINTLTVNKKFEQADIAMEKFRSILIQMDELLAAHSLNRLNRWVDKARWWASLPEEKAYYEADAKRIVTYWGGTILSEYAGKLWQGLIADYYLPRWESWYESQKRGEVFDINAWEKHWVETPQNFSIKKKVENSNNKN